ncbi:hypothetical protein [Enterococcus rotai]
MSKNASIILTAVLEYIITEILELSCNNAEKLGKKRIMPRHITLAI